jgi:hypothetical protein
MVASLLNIRPVFALPGLESGISSTAASMIVEADVEATA